jgi:hypothetical protein
VHWPALAWQPSLVPHAAAPALVYVNV